MRIGSFGKMKDLGNYECEGQMNLFDLLEQPQNISNPVEVYLEKAIMRGTGFEGGKERVANLYKENLTAKERVKRIKEEYGTGGQYWPLDGYGLHGHDTYLSCFRILWRDESGEHEDVVNWNHVEEVIHSLINRKKYS